jgi:hypothetical protein
MGQQSSPAQGKYQSPAQPQGKYNRAPDAIIRNSQTGQGPEANLPQEIPGMPTGNNEGGTDGGVIGGSQGMAPYPGSPGSTAYPAPPPGPDTAAKGGPQGKYLQTPQGKYNQPQLPSSQQALAAAQQYVQGQQTPGTVSPGYQGSTQLVPPSSAYGQPVQYAQQVNNGTSQLPPELQQAIRNGGDEADFAQMGYVKNQQGQWVKG